jgi:hypothetical protein
MIEILKQGIVIKKAAPKLKGTCNGCSCEVMVTQDDPNILPYPRSNPTFQINCPMKGCGGIITLKPYVTREAHDFQTVDQVRDSGCGEH